MSHGTGEPGQTFTTGTNATGYMLTSVAVRTGGIGSSSGTSTPQPYYLHIYSVSGSTATLLETYTSGNVAFNDGDWLKWSGLSVRLLPNATYAYSFGKASSTSGWEPMAVATNALSGGEIAMIPTAGGTITTGSSHKFDAVFDLGLGAGPTNIPASMPWPNPTCGMNVGNDVGVELGCRQTRRCSTRPPNRVQRRAHSVRVGHVRRHHQHQRRRHQLRNQCQLHGAGQTDG